jgi:hypothetical protein
VTASSEDQIAVLARWEAAHAVWRMVPEGATPSRSRSVDAAAVRRSGASASADVRALPGKADCVGRTALGSSRDLFIIGGC